jgi:hypothetical protein
VKHRFFTLPALMLAGLCLVSCATRHEHAPRLLPPPAWTQSPKPNDSVYMYRVGMATGEATAAAAREAAHQDALRQITRSIMNEIAGAAAGPGGEALNLTGAEIMPGCSYTVRTRSGYDGWVQVSFPLDQKRQIVESLNRR